ncbi:S1 family peptidase [Corynebacterium uberis]|uniref:S1 family peptidase n=1 Tax=Corynebacterium uberis TaxID=2883169 RepID=UPI001D0AAAD0|nr:S1 family peptidase [Corynebacterium uberis]UDL82027.1 S1 family peptidase [Corynebacterium uberis]
MTIRTRCGAIIAAAAAATMLLPAVAGAAEVAPGAPMRMPGEQPANVPVQVPPELLRGSCSQGVPGTVTLPDGSTKRVMVTAAHCVIGITKPNPGPEVYVPTRDGDKLIGVADQGVPAYEPTFQERPAHEEIRDALDAPDWGTVALRDDVTTSRAADSKDQFGVSHGQPVILTGIRDYPDLAIWEVSVDNAGEPICKDGSTTGRSCGIQLFRTSNGIWSVGLGYDHGDSGGVNFDPQTGEALGVTSMGIGPLQRAQPIDVALEQAYGIPDGQVNERFQLPEGTEQADDMRTLTDDHQVIEAWAEENLPPAPDYVADLNTAVTAAHTDAVAAGQQLAGDVAAVAQAAPNPQAVTAAVKNAQGTVEQGVATAQAHADTIDQIAPLALIQQIESQK